METAFRKYPTHVCPEDVNLMLEVLLAQQDHLKCIQVLINYGGVKLLSEVSGNSTTIFRSFYCENLLIKLF